MPLVVEPCRHCGRRYKTRKPDAKPTFWLGALLSYNDCLNEQQDFCPCQAHQPGDKGYTPRGEPAPGQRTLF